MPYTDWTLKQLEQARYELIALNNELTDASVEFALSEIDLELTIRNLTEIRDRTCTS